MPELTKNGVTLNYETFGTKGPWITFTPGGRRPYSDLIDIAKSMSENGFRVLLHDRRNCGASDVRIEPSPSENDLWANDLYGLIREVAEFPLYVGGASAGARMALLFARRYPMDVTGLLLWRISGGRDATEKLAKSYFTEFIDAAQRGGMEAVCETPHFAESIRSRPSNRDRLLGMKVDEFVEILQTWRDEFLQSVDFPVVGASEADLQSIGIPSCLISGNDIVHTPSAARAAHAALQKSELHSDVVEVRDESALLPEWNRKQWADAEPNVVRIFIEFLRKLQ